MSMTPVLIVYLLIMDLLFIIQVVIIKNILLVINYFSGKKIPEDSMIHSLERFEDDMFKVVFNMEKHEIAGFKRLRTIS